MPDWLTALDVFLRVMGVLVLPVFFWWFNWKVDANHRRLKQAVDEAQALTLSGASRLIRRHSSDLARLTEIAAHLSGQVDLLFAKVELLDVELRTGSGDGNRAAGRAGKGEW